MKIKIPDPNVVLLLKVTIVQNMYVYKFPILIGRIEFIL